MGVERVGVKILDIIEFKLKKRKGLNHFFKNIYGWAGVGKWNKGSGKFFNNYIYKFTKFYQG